MNEQNIDQNDWPDPLPPHPEDVERWATFCLTVEDRIEQARRDEDDQDRPLRRAS